jgi:hypothetical protein
MAAHEIYDYLSAVAVTPDYDAVLEISPQKVLYEEASKNQVVHLGDDDSEVVISFSDDTIFYVRLLWEELNESDAGTIFDWWNDTEKANGKARSFKWQDHGVTDQHTYTVRFDSDVTRSIRMSYIFGFAEIRLKILGRAPV